MITDIHISNVASYDATGISLLDLKKTNFIYGANGSGKTTISNFLATTSLPCFEQSTVTWAHNSPLHVHAYNREFRKKNFSSGTIAGVFTLGQATQEDLQLITQKSSDLSALKDQQFQQKRVLAGQEDKLSSCIAELTEKCWKLYKQYDDDFKNALRGSIGSKTAFRDKLLTEQATNSSLVEPITSLREKATTLLGRKPDRLAPISTINFANLNALESDSAWKKVIVGKNDVDIAGLINKLGNSDWVNQGRPYLSSDGTCPFCQQQTIDELFTQQIGEYFDETFEQDKSNLASLQYSYELASTEASQLLEQIETREKTNQNSKLNIEGFSAHLKAIQSQFSENRGLIQSKLEKTSQEVELSDTKSELTKISTLIDQANQAVTAHNQLVDNYDQEIADLKSSIWRFLVEELSQDLKASNQARTGLEKGIESIQQQLSHRSTEMLELEGEIVERNRNVTSVQPAVDEINRSLKAYGFLNLQIVPSQELDNHYLIQRECGELAHETLSEGEVTFITFLYFVQLSKGALDQDSVTVDRVLVIDDPISSLDSNVLYVVSSIIKDLIKGVKEGTSSVKQIFLLTHNVYFHKEASFQNGRSNGDSDVHFWILRKNQNITSVQAYEQKNPIESSYELLWREIKEWQQNSGITLQNTMRRIIENYFKILGKLDDDDLITKFTTIEDQQICRSLIHWINDGSHTIPDDLFVQSQDDSTEKYLAVFEKVFELTNNHGHYQMMMGQLT